MIRTCLVAALLPLGAPLLAETKAESCAWQAKVVNAVQQARLDRVPEKKVQEAILETAPDWPENYNAAIPLVTPWVYEMKRREVKAQDLGAAWEELCLQQ